MILAHMLETDEGALICDLAETYGIYDYMQLPPLTVATLAVGLREDARIRMKMSGVDYSLETILLASAVDRLSLLLWSKTKDGEKGRRRPKSIVEQLMKKTNSEIRAFRTPEALEKEWRRIAGGERIG